MDVGIFARIFTRPTLAETLDVIGRHGIRTLQFNMSCAGLDTLPERITDAQTDAIIAELDRHHMNVAALSGTFNMIHPDRAVRDDGLRRLRVLAGAAQRMKVPLITLCTGTRDPQNMWRRHPDNVTPKAWEDLVESMRAAVQIADDYDLQLGVEPELSNVINSARAARRLLDTLHSPRIKIIMDGSNLLHAGEVSRMHRIFDEAFELLGNDIALAHAKDLMAGSAESHGAAGTGVLDYDYYLHGLQRIGYTGPLILHTLREEQVDASVTFLKKKLEHLPG